MKKMIVLLVFLVTAIFLTACSGEKSPVVSSAAPMAVSSKAADPAPTPTPEPTPEPAVSFSIGDTAEIGNWKISVSNIEFAEKIESSAYTFFAPNTDGNKYLSVSITVENTGKEADTFLSSFSYGDDIVPKLVFGDGYEFSRTNLLGYEQEISDEVINPLSSISGVIVFDVPPTVEESTEPLSLIFKNTSAEATFILR